MKSFLFLSSLILVITSGKLLWAVDFVGVREITITAPERGKTLSVMVWYPASAGGKHTMIGDNKIFKGTPAYENAPLAEGHFPLILVSHGSGARIQNMGWITTKLVQAGFIVAGPNHPGTTSGDSLPIDTPKLWERTQDLSTLLTVLTTDSLWRDSIVKEQIGVFGFSLGGAAAMELTGARSNLEEYARYCDRYKTMPDCVWFTGEKGYIDGKAVVTEKVNLRQIDKRRFEQSNLDQRIKSAVFIDPALAQAFDPESLKEIRIPLTFINLGQQDTIPVGVIADTLSKLPLKASYVQINEAVHFSFLAECKEGGAELLKLLGDTDLLCSEQGKRSRSDIHAELQKIITEVFIRTLKKGPGE